MIDIFEILIAVLPLLASLLFPFYVAYFIFLKHRVKTQYLPASSGPSWWTFALYISLLAIYWLISVPAFFAFQTRAKSSEAKTNLVAIYVAQLNYFSINNTFAGGPKAFDFLKWEPAGFYRYNYYLGEDVIFNESGGLTSLRPGRDWPFRVHAESSDSGFTALAIGNTDRDEFLSFWSINDAKVLQPWMDDDWDTINENVYLAPPKNSFIQVSRSALKRWMLQNGKVFIAIQSFILLPFLMALAFLLYRDQKRYSAAKAKAVN